MGQIKSALELALERTRDLKSDKEGLRNATLLQEGKKLASRILSGEEIDVGAALNGFAPDEQPGVREGIAAAVMANINLPATASANDTIGRMSTIVIPLAKSKAAAQQLIEQVSQLYTQYLADRERMVTALETQFAPRLKQREEELARKTGQRTPINPATDPEFLKYLKQTLAQLDQHYTPVIQQARDHIADQLKR